MVYAPSLIRLLAECVSLPAKISAQLCARSSIALVPCFVFTSCGELWNGECNNGYPSVSSLTASLNQCMTALQWSFWICCSVWYEHFIFDVVFFGYLIQAACLSLWWSAAEMHTDNMHCTDFTYMQVLVLLYGCVLDLKTMLCNVAYGGTA